MVSPGACSQLSALPLMAGGSTNKHEIERIIHGWKEKQAKKEEENLHNFNTQQYLLLQDYE